MAKKLKLPLVRTRFPKIRDCGAAFKKRYLVDGRPFFRRRFALLTEARAFADLLATERANQGTESLSFLTTDRITAANCIKRLAAHGKTLTDATDFFVAHLTHEQRRKDSLLVSACIDQFFDQLQKDVGAGTLARNSFREARFRAREFDSTFGALHVAELTEETFRAYLDQRPGSAQTKRNIWGAFSKFCTFCMRRGYIEKNPVTGLRIKVPRRDVQILSVDEARTLLHAAGASNHAGELVPYFAIALFAGLRPTEIQKLDWRQISLVTKSITVSAHTTKVRETRYVPINLTLELWLSPFIRASGTIVGRNFVNKFRRVLRAAGYGIGRRWVSDIARHSFGSYHLALHKNRAELAEVLGNSLAIIRRHYRAPVLESDALAYFGLRPNE